MGEPEIRAALDLHWSASANGNLEAEHDIYDDNVLCEYPQSGERILGRSNLQALRSHHPGKPSGFNLRRILGNGDLWITEYTIMYQGRPAYTLSIMEFPQWQGRARDTVFRGSLRGAGLAEAMGPADRVTPHLGLGNLHARRRRCGHRIRPERHELRDLTKSAFEPVTCDGL